MEVADLSVGPPGEPEVADSIEEAPAPLPDVDESVVRGLLRGLGAGLGHVAGNPDIPGHWRFSEEELDALTPPLTRIINRRPAWRRAVARGDEATVAVVLASWAGRHVSAARRLRTEEESHGLEAEAESPPDGARAAPPPEAGGPGPDGGLRGWLRPAPGGGPL